MEEKPVTSYSEESKIIKFKAKTGEFFDIEVVEEPKEKLKNIKDKVVGDISSITKRALGDPGDLAKKWFYMADILAIARREGRIKGYAIGKYIRDTLFFFPVTMVLPQDRNKGLAMFMNYTILRMLWRRRIKKAKWRIWKWFQPLYITFRTYNPILYRAISKRIDVVPSVKGRIPSPQEVKIAREVANLSSPEYKFDPQTFVIEGALSSYPELFKNENVPWTSDRRVNEFFEKHLKLSEKKGNVFVVVGRVPKLLWFVLAIINFWGK